MWNKNTSSGSTTASFQVVQELLTRKGNLPFHFFFTDIVYARLGGHKDRPRGTSLEKIRVGEHNHYTTAQVSEFNERDEQQKGRERKKKECNSGICQPQAWGEVDTRKKNLFCLNNIPTFFKQRET